MAAAQAKFAEKAREMDEKRRRDPLHLARGVQQAIEKKKTNYSFRIWQAGRRGAAYLLRNLMNEELKDAEATVTVEFEQSLVSIKMPAGEPKPKGFNMYAELNNMKEKLNPELASKLSMATTKEKQAEVEKDARGKMTVNGEEVLKMLSELNVPRESVNASLASGSRDELTTAYCLLWQKIAARKEAEEAMAVGGGEEGEAPAEGGDE